MASSHFRSKNFNLPENGFFFHNSDLKSLQFVLDWDTKDKFYHNLLEQFYGDIKRKPNEHAMVLTNPAKSTYCHGQIPAFDIKFIEDVFENGEYPDPTTYIVKSSCPINYSKDDIFNCWFHHKKTWSNLIPIQTNNNDGNISEIQSFSNNRHHAFNSDFSDENTNLRSFPTSSTLLSTSYKNSDKNTKSSTATSSTSVFSGKRTRLPYSHKEDQEIVKYVLKNKYALNVTGVTLWQKMERDKVCKIRSWQSMKERYLKHIKFDLTTGSKKFPFLTREDLKILRQGLNIDSMKRTEKDKLKSKFQDQRMMVDDNYD